MSDISTKCMEVFDPMQIKWLTKCYIYFTHVCHIVWWFLWRMQNNTVTAVQSTGKECHRHLMIHFVLFCPVRQKSNLIHFSCDFVKKFSKVFYCAMYLSFLSKVSQNTCTISYMSKVFNNTLLPVISVKETLNKLTWHIRGNVLTLKLLNSKELLQSLLGNVHNSQLNKNLYKILAGVTTANNSPVWEIKV